MTNKIQEVAKVGCRISVFMLAAILFPALVFCQNAAKLSVTDPNSKADTISPPPPYEQLDLKDWLQNKHWIKKKPASKSFLVIIPVISSNPVAGLIYGAGLNYTYNTSPSDKRLSTISSNASYSTNDLLNVGVRTNIFTGHEKWVFNGDWRYLATVETTYGLGTDRASNGYINLNGYNTANDTKGQTLQFNQIRFHEMASREVSADFFAGLGFQYDRYTDVKDDFLSSGGDTASSYNYKYNKERGFNPSSYTTSGLCLNLIFDNRDNSIDAYKGYYANINYQVNTTALGSTKNSSVMMVDYRAFYSLDSLKKNILAVWFYGDFLTSGSVPYLGLPSIGHDPRQRTGRGYTFGRFRGEDLAYLETEYRFPFSQVTGILGGVVFVNLTTTTDKENHIYLMDDIRGAYGCGLRVMLDKKSRTRLELDAASGQNTLGFYLNVQEAF